MVFTRDYNFFLSYARLGHSTFQSLCNKIPLRNALLSKLKTNMCPFSFRFFNKNFLNTSHRPNSYNVHSLLHLHLITMKSAY